MSNNIGAGLVDSKDHEKPVFFGERVRLEKRADPLPDQGEIAAMTGKLEFFLTHVLEKLAKGGRWFKSGCNAADGRRDNGLKQMDSRMKRLFSFRDV